MARHRRRSGLTLIELMIAMAIAVLLLAMTAPSMRSLILRSRLEGVISELSLDLYYARSEALRRRSTVNLITNANGSGYAINVGVLSLKAVSLPTGVTLTPETTLAFDGVRGATLGDAALDGAVAGHDALGLRASVTAVGRVSVCVSRGKLPGTPAC
ncbi:MAG: prepilin-type N-terminal cleavage/methylation domain-containing protein [Burkholderiaceae bacterium]|nr:prepilin-type N-terminal cleavage/methylation domain-containing protein [Burkholderiaceae bacterium]